MKSILTSPLLQFATSDFVPPSFISGRLLFPLLTLQSIDKLLEADVYYTKQDYSYSFAVGAGENETFGEKSDEYAYLKYTDKVEHTGDGLFAGTYKWDRIETVEQFKQIHGRIKKAAYAHRDCRRRRYAVLIPFGWVLGWDNRKSTRRLPCAFSHYCSFANLPFAP